MWDSKTLAGLMEPSMVTIFGFLRRALREEGKKHGLNFTHISALRVLGQGSGVRLTELAATLELSSSACSAMVDQLEKRGLLEKGLDAGDRRATLVAATPEGTRLTQRLLTSTYERIAEALQVLPGADRYLVLGGLDTLATVIEKLDAP